MAPAAGYASDGPTIGPAGRAEDARRELLRASVGRRRRSGGLSSGQSDAGCRDNHDTNRRRRLGAVPAPVAPTRVGHHCAPAARQSVRWAHCRHADRPATRRRDGEWGRAREGFPPLVRPPAWLGRLRGGRRADSPGVVRVLASRVPSRVCLAPGRSTSRSRLCVGLALALALAGCTAAGGLAGTEGRPAACEERAGGGRPTAGRGRQLRSGRFDRAGVPGADLRLVRRRRSARLDHRRTDVAGHNHKTDASCRVNHGRVCSGGASARCRGRPACADPRGAKALPTWKPAGRASVRWPDGGEHERGSPLSSARRPGWVGSGEAGGRIPGLAPALVSRVPSWVCLAPGRSTNRLRPGGGRAEGQRVTRCAVVGAGGGPAADVERGKGEATGLAGGRRAEGGCVWVLSVWPCVRVKSGLWVVRRWRCCACVLFCLPAVRPARALDRCLFWSIVFAPVFQRSGAAARGPVGDAGRRGRHLLSAADGWPARAPASADGYFSPGGAGTHVQTHKRGDVRRQVSGAAHRHSQAGSRPGWLCCRAVSAMLNGRRGLWAAAAAGGGSFRHLDASGGRVQVLWDCRVSSCLKVRQRRSERFLRRLCSDWRGG